MKATFFGTFQTAAVSLVLLSMLGGRLAAAEPGEIRGAPIKSRKSAAALTNAPTAAPVVDAAKATTLASGKTVVEEASAPVMVEGSFLRVGFDRLSGYNFAMPDDLASTNTAPGLKTDDQIPASVRALDQKEIALKGFMLPLKVEAGLVTELLVLRDQSMCCYGSVPKINEWVTVKFKGKGVKAVMDQPVTICGKFKVGELRENGYLVGIYEMAGEKLAGIEN